MIKSLLEVDEAFKEKLEGLEIEGKPVPVMYINPEQEYAEKAYPAIVLSRSGAYPDFSRWSNDVINFDYKVVDGLPITYKEKNNPEPYLIYYIVRLYYNYQEDGVLLNNYLMTKLKRGSYVVIEGDKYDLELVSYKNPNSTYREFGKVKTNKDREFIDQYFYRLEINLEIGDIRERTLTSSPPEIRTDSLDSEKGE